MARTLRYPHKYTVRADDNVDAFLQRRAAKTKKDQAVVIRDILEEQATTENPPATEINDEGTPRNE